MPTAACIGRKLIALVQKASARDSGRYNAGDCARFRRGLESRKAFGAVLSAQLNPRDDVAEKLDVALGAGRAFLKALEEYFFRAVALAAQELAMHHDALV
jgi:hypothetical protein